MSSSSGPLMARCCRSHSQNRSRSRPALPGADAARSVRAGRGRQRRALAVSELKVHECDSLDRRARNDPVAKAAIHWTDDESSTTTRADGVGHGRSWKARLVRFDRSSGPSDRRASHRSMRRMASKLLPLNSGRRCKISSRGRHLSILCHREEFSPSQPVCTGIIPETVHIRSAFCSSAFGARRPGTDATGVLR
jgi:hypothetical protein